MFSLPTASPKASNADRDGLPLGEHAGLLLASGLLHEDLDDQRDTIRAALEIDPLLSTWAVCTAHRLTGAKLYSIETASRWLVDAFPRAVESPSRLIPGQPWDAVRRASWQKTLITAVATARQAWRLAVRDEAASGLGAFWLAQLCSSYEQLRGRGKEDGRGFVRELTLAWPPWLVAETESVRRATPGEPTRYAVRLAMQALAEQPELATQLVGQEETQLWFRPYPEFRMLVPSLLHKLCRLATLEESFEAALQQEKLASLEQLAYGASHEINNPLANISTRAQTLLSNEQNHDRRRKLVAINEQAFRAYEMIADLMLFAKPPRLDLEEVNLHALLRSLRDELEPLAIKQDTRLCFTVDEACPHLLGDPVQVCVAIKAICVNGLEAMEQRGVLSLHASREPVLGEGVAITIEDTGPGLSELARRHLFDPFFSGREAGRGLGFGLSKAWRIVGQHGGRISVSSRSLSGCTFTLILPCAGPPSSPSLTIAKNGNA